MKDNPLLAKRMNDVRESLASNPIEILTTPSDDCPYQKCDGTGWLWFKNWSRSNMRDGYNEEGEWMDESLRAEWWEQCKCYEQLIKQREIDKKLDLSGIPPIFSSATVHSYDISKYKTQDNRDTATIAKKAAIKFVENYQAMKEHGKGLYLYSEIKGSGKTRLASSIANALVKMYDVDIAFLKANDLLSQIKKTFNGDSDTTESDIIRLFREVEVLVVDDLAVEKASDFAERIFYDITDYRLEHKKTTLFTSNKTIENLGDIYKDGRLKSRVKKMSIEIYMPEESIRDQEAESENAELEGLLFG